MLKLLTCILVVTATLLFSEEAETHPKHINIKDPLTALFDIWMGDTKLGTVYRSLRYTPLTESICYEFFDENQQLCAQAELNWQDFNFSSNPSFTITDIDGCIIGQAKESFSCCGSCLEILSPQQEILGFTQPNFWHTKIILKDPKNKQSLALLSIPFFRKQKKRKLHILHPELLAENTINIHLFILVAIFHSEMEIWREQVDL
jgi:hypothetical protein